MKKILTIFGAAILIVPVFGNAQETIESVYVEGIAPIAIDGDLSDWDILNLPPIPITGVNPLSKPGRPRDAADLSASFRCIADDENVYVGVKVTDDIIHFGEEPIGRPFWDDCVELLFYGDKTGNSPLKIWVSEDKNGRVKLEGREPVEKKSYPFLWQRQGVIAALGKGDKGYSVEVMIPNEVIGLTGWVKGEPVRMNVFVYDDDSNKEKFNIIQWLNEACNIMFKIKQNIYINFDDVKNEEKKIFLNLDYPFNKDNFNEIFEVAEAYQKSCMYKESIYIINNIIIDLKEQLLYDKATLLLAKNYFYTKQYDLCNKLSHFLIRSQYDEIMFESSLILYTLKRNNFINEE